VSVRVKDGTPLFGPSLCETCSNAHIEKGYRESEQVVFCTATYFEHRVQFRVRQCSGYREVKRQTLKQMEEIAWILPSCGNKRAAGFAPPSKPSSDGEEEVTLVLNKER
jgi:uncharacterized cysteine cluster protein YcgN (CxxCxxCC family)